METILELAKRLAKIRLESETAKKIFDELNEEKKEIQKDLIESMKKHKLKSIKTDTHNFARVVKRSFNITDHELIMKSLENEGIKQAYVKDVIADEYSAIEFLKENEPKFIEKRLDTAKIDSFLKEKFKEGEIIDGSELRETEYMTVKSI